MSDDCRFELGRRGFLGATSHAQKRRNAERMRNDEAIPGAVDVIITQPEDKGPHERVERLGRSPAALLEAYLASKGVDDPALIELFRELEEEVLAR